MKQRSGFTVIEIIFVIIISLAATWLVLSQKHETEASTRDRERKTAINAMYFQLINVYYKQNGHYPNEISPDILPGLDPAIFTDPLGTYISDPGSNYFYEANNCDENNRCQKFKLSATLEKEAIYEKSN